MAAASGGLSLAAQGGLLAAGSTTGAYTALAGGAMLGGIGYSTYNLVGGHQPTLQGYAFSMSAGGLMGSATYGVSNGMWSRPISHDPASMAARAQGNARYPGVDNWVNVTLPKGSYVWGGSPNPSNFYTTNSVMNLVGNDATRLGIGLQITRGRYPTFRAGMTMYQVNTSITVGYSHALANTQYGIGGFPQYYIPNTYSYQNVLQPILTRLMTNL